MKKEFKTYLFNKVCLVHEEKGSDRRDDLHRRSFSISKS